MMHYQEEIVKFNIGEVNIRPYTITRGQSDPSYILRFSVHFLSTMYNVTVALKASLPNEIVLISVIE